MSSCPSSQLPGPAIKHQSPDPSQQLLTDVLLANIHPQSCSYPHNSQVTVSPCPSQLQHRAGPSLSCFPGQEGFLLPQARQAPGKATGAGKIQSNMDVRKPLTQQNRRQLQTTGTACSISSSQAALCCTAQGKLNPNTGKQTGW